MNNLQANKPNPTQKIKLNHNTSYHFDRLTSIMPHVVRLHPAPHCGPKIESYSLAISPENHTIHWQQDPFSNQIARLFFPEPATKLSFNVEIYADIVASNPFFFLLEESVTNYPFDYEPILADGLAPYLKIVEQGPALVAWLANVDKSKQATVDFLVKLNTRLHKDLAYQVRYEEGVQSCEYTLKEKTASCRDSAWLLIQLLRHLGFAARFVSGYAIKLEDEEDTVDLHAWAEVYLPGAGWIGLDPTSGLLATGPYIPLACTPEPTSAAAISGSTSPCEVELSYSTTITRLA